MAVRRYKKTATYPGNSFAGLQKPNQGSPFLPQRGQEGGWGVGGGNTKNKPSNSSGRKAKKLNPSTAPEPEAKPQESSPKSHQKGFQGESP